MSLLAPAVPADAPCVAVYSRLRDGVPADSAQIGFGYNHYPLCPAVPEFLTAATKVCVHRGRLSEYGTVHDGHDRALAAALLSRYLGVAVDGDQVVFTNGATEGIAITMRFLAECGAGVWLPLPCYYAFEQNLVHHRGQVLGYYHDRDQRHLIEASPGRAGVVDIVPNGVTGGLLTPPPGDFRVVDVVFQARNDATSDAVVAATRRAVGISLADAAVLMTPAKDLCLPGLRAGVLVSGSLELLAAARRKHFTDLASINPVLGLVNLLYLAALLLADADRELGGLKTFYRWIRAEFARFGVEPIPSLKTCCAIVDHWAAMARHNRIAHQILADRGEGILQLHHPMPMAGYSTLARLRLDLATADDLVAWVNTTGRSHRLKLNPHLLFGGTPHTWATLHPGARDIRINLSVPHEMLAATLATLRLAIDDAVIITPAGVALR